MNNHKIIYFFIIIFLLFIFLLFFSKPSNNNDYNKNFAVFNPKNIDKPIYLHKKQQLNNQNNYYFEPFYNQNTLNIYDEPLKSCGSPNMSNGSWDNNYKCSETGGGVHQICIKNIAKNTRNFSKLTGQSDWSDKRGNDNHCVCLGAWSLYNKKNNTNNNVLKCDAIPKISLSKNYISKFSEGWNKWNGLELQDQIKHGVESLVNNCYQSNDPKSEKLKINYCNFARDIKALNTNSSLYNNLCN